MMVEVSLILFLIGSITTMDKVPKIKLNNGVDIPIIGLGTWHAEPGKVGKAVQDAIDIGYRHIDCAYLYQNQKEIGNAINNKISQGVVRREDLFVTSKLWNTFHRPGIVERILRSDLKDMGLDYFDLYLIHWPTGFKEGDSALPVGPNGLEFSDYDYVDTWKAMEGVYKKGLVKAIGVSNFNKHQLQRVLDVATVTPVMYQVECHPYLNQNDLIEFCKSKGIAVTAYSPLGSPGFNSTNVKLLDDVKLAKIAKKYKKSVAQIAIRFQIQRNVAVIPKSTNKKRLAENFNVFDFALSNADMQTIMSLNRNLRYVPFDEMKNHRYYPFNDKEARKPSKL